MKKFILFPLFLYSLTCAAVEFKDVPPNHWAVPYIEELLDLGIISGYSDNTFRGKQIIKRYDLIVFLAKYNRYLDEKFNLLMANIGEGPAPASIRNDGEDKLVLLEELEENVLSLRNDVVFLEKKVKDLSNGGGSGVSFSLDSKAIVDLKNQDSLVYNGALGYKNHLDNVDFFVDLNFANQSNNSDYLGTEAELSGSYDFPIAEKVYFSLEKGPGDKLNSYGEVLSYKRDKIRMKTEIIPLSVSLLPVNSNRNVLELTYSQSLAVSSYMLDLGWTKKYLYATKLSRLVKTNGVLDNKDTFWVGVKIDKLSVLTKLGTGVNSNHVFLFQVDSSDFMNMDINFKALSLGDNAYDSNLGDSYEYYGAIDIFDMPIPNGSAYYSLSLGKVMEQFHGALAINSVGNDNRIKMLAGMTISINKQVKLVKEVRYSDDDVIGKNLAGVISLKVDF